MKTDRVTFGVLLCSIFVATGSLAAQEAKIAPAAGQEWTNVFAESRAEVAFSVQAPAGFRGRLVWTLADVGTDRVLPRGRGEVPVAAGQKMPVKFTLDFPFLNEGVVLKANLAVSLIDDAAKDISATYAKPIWIFHADPFVNRTKVLEDLKITVYDPDPKAVTAAALNGLKVPFEQVNNPAALAGKVVIVGEGASFVAEPDLPKTLLNLAKQGATVICLAPEAGTFALPGAEQDDGENVSLLRRQAITQLDPRLDAQTWLNSASNLYSTIAVKSIDGSVVGEVTKGAGGFPWVQVDFPESKGRLTICGFAVIRQWERTPTPRYLLDEMMKPAIPAVKE